MASRRDRIEKLRRLAESPNEHEAASARAEVARRNMEEVCHNCASGRGGLGSGDKIVEGEVNWENPDLFCAGCNKRIESAYAD